MSPSVQVRWPALALYGSAENPRISIRLALTSPDLTDAALRTSARVRSRCLPQAFAPVGSVDFERRVTDAAKGPFRGPARGGCTLVRGHRLHEGQARSVLGRCDGSIEWVRRSRGRRSCNVNRSPLSSRRTNQDRPLGTISEGAGELARRATSGSTGETRAITRVAVVVVPRRSHAAQFGMLPTAFYFSHTQFSRTVETAHPYVTVVPASGEGSI